MKKPNILVVGSTNMDMVGNMENLPKPGQTVLGNSFHMNPGGKGANQAVASAKLGANTTFISALGDDQLGDTLFHNLQKYKVNTDYIKRVPNCSSGVALISVAERGWNQIVVIPGANSQLSPNDIRERRKVFDNTDIVLLQLEIPIETVYETIKIAYVLHIPVILNPAPATPLEDELLKQVTYLTPNEFEAALYGLRDYPTLEAFDVAARYFLKSGVQHLIITRGENGAMYFSKDDKYRVKAPKVNAIDSTAAGDAFNAGFAYSLCLGNSIKDSIRFANCVGALSVTKPGAQQSMPTLAEVKSLLHSQPPVQ